MGKYHWLSVPSRRDRQAAVILVVRLAEHLDSFVELHLRPDLVTSVVEIMSWRQFHGQQAAPVDWPSPITQPSQRQGQHIPSHILNENNITIITLIDRITGVIHAISYSTLI